VGLGTGTGASVESVDGPGTAARGQLMVTWTMERGGGNEIGERQREGAAADTDEKKDRG